MNERHRRRLPEGRELLFGLGERGWWRGGRHFEGQGLGRVGASLRSSRIALEATRLSLSVYFTSGGRRTAWIG